jgi:hypothetical protein
VEPYRCGGWGRGGAHCVGSDLSQFPVEGRTRPEVTDTRQKLAAGARKETAAGDPRVQAGAVLRF